MNELEQKIKEVMENKLDTYVMAIENSVDEVLEVIMPVINTEVQKEREEAVGGFVEKLIKEKTDFGEEDDWLDVRGIEVKEMVKDYLSQTKGGKDA